MKFLEIALFLVAVWAFADGKPLRDFEEECRKELGEDALQSCVVACAMEKQGTLVDGKFNLQAANDMIDQIADRIPPPSVNRTKNAYKVCNDELASVSTDKCSTAAAFFYCIHHRAHSRFAFGANRDDLTCPCPDGPDFFRRGGPGGPHGPHGPDGPEGSEGFDGMKRQKPPHGFKGSWGFWGPPAHPF